MKFIGLGLFLAGCSLALGEEWKPLLNGTDFSGWETYLAKPAASVQIPGLERDAKGEYAAPIGVNRDPQHAFSYVKIEGNPTLHISGDVPGGIATIASFSNYHLRLEFKWGELRTGQKSTQLRNSGLLYHGHGQHGEGNGRWLQSHQFQIQNGFCGDYIAMGDGAALIRARRAEEKRFVFDLSGPEVQFSNTPPDLPRCGTAGGAENAMDQWNTLELYCVGDQVVHVVNGTMVLRAESGIRKPDGTLVPLKEGRIEFQAEGWDIYFRNVEIASIDEIPAKLLK